MGPLPPRDSAEDLAARIVGMMPGRYEIRLGDEIQEIAAMIRSHSTADAHGKILRITKEMQEYHDSLEEEADRACSPFPDWISILRTLINPEV